MLDMQKARLRHLMANAILELWKKETGSQSPVFIEGTVCITSHNGRTTTIQVADQFPGSPQDGASNYFLSPADEANRGGASLAVSSPTRQHSVNGNSSASRTLLDGTSANEQRQPSEGEKLSTQERSKGMSKSPQKSCVKQIPSRSRRVGGSARSISTVNQQLRQLQQQQLLQLQLQQQQQQQQRLVLAKDDNNNNQSADTELTTGVDDKLDSSSSSDDDDCSDLDRSIGSYSSRRRALDISAITSRRSNAEQDQGSSDEENNNDSAIQDMSVDLSTSEPCCSKSHQSAATSESAARATLIDRESESNVSGKGVGRGNEERGKVFEEGREVVDLSRRDTDLLISSPQSYTDQVRDAIRRRLQLATTSLPMLSLGISPLGPFIPTSAPNPSSSSSPQDLFRPVRDSPYARSTSLIAMSGWQSPQLIKNPANRVTAGRAASGSSPLDVRTLATPFSPPSAQFVFPPGSQASILMPSLAAQRKSLVDGRSQAPAPFLSPASLHKMLSVAGVSTARLVIDQSQNDHADDRSQLASMHVEDDDDDSSALDSMSASNSGGGADLLNSSGIGGGEPRVYRCDYCAKTFLFKSKYHEHLPVHTSARPFRCHLCARTYKYKYDLRVHLRTHLGIPTKSTVCPFCAADKFATNKQLRLHIREAHGDQQRIGEEQCARSLEGLAAGRAGGLITGAALVSEAAASSMGSAEMGGIQIKTETGSVINAGGMRLGMGTSSEGDAESQNVGVARLSGGTLSPGCSEDVDVCSSSVGVELNGGVGHGREFSLLTPGCGVTGASETPLLLA